MEEMKGEKKEKKIKNGVVFHYLNLNKKTVSHWLGA